MGATRKKPIKSLLAAATCSLLAPVQTIAADSGWQLDSAVLVYNEADRVTAVEPVIKANKTFEDDSKISLKLVLDSLTGASHNGATVSDQPQTFTRPSGIGEYTVQPGEIPLDDTFKDTRVAFGAQWTQPINRLLSYSIGGNISSEFDFESLSLNGSLSRDFNNKNTSLNIGLSIEEDKINPKGGVPLESSDTSLLQKRTATESKSIIDFLVGLTQVINQKMIMQFTVGHSNSKGYMTDPYKMVSVHDGAGLTLNYLYEGRPDTRTKNSFYWKTKYHLEKDILDVSYRFMTDDWGISSHTMDFKYRSQFEGFYIEPHFRYYVQNEADFYNAYIDDAPSFPRYLSADYRLSDLDTNTIGVKAGISLDSGNEISFRVEYYQQQGSTKPADVNAVFFQLGYHMSL